jgi:hypothetical protein
MNHIKASIVFAMNFLSFPFRICILFTTVLDFLFSLESDSVDPTSPVGVVGLEIEARKTLAQN